MNIIIIYNENLWTDYNLGLNQSKIKIWIAVIFLVIYQIGQQISFKEQYHPLGGMVGLFNKVFNQYLMFPPLLFVSPG